MDSTQHIIPAQHTATVLHVERLSCDIAQLQLSLIEASAFSYRAGQFIAIHLPGGTTRCYSMAHSHVTGAPLEFHIRLQPNGVFSQWLIEALSDPSSICGKALTISGPYGECTWDSRDFSESLTILLGTGTGIAPLAALVEEALATGSQKSMILYWGGRQTNDFYCAPKFEALALRHTNFHFVPVINSAKPIWNGRRGFVQDCAARDFPDLKVASVYACGSPQMVRSAHQTLVSQCGLDPERFYSDAFIPSEVAGNNEGVRSIHARLRLADGQTKTLQLTTTGSLMNALRAQGYIAGICGGQKSCGSCRVEISPAWSAHISPPDRAETRLLAALDSPSLTDRLACQIALTPDLDGLELAILDRAL